MAYKNGNKKYHDKIAIKNNSTYFPRILPTSLEEQYELKLLHKLIKKGIRKKLSFYVILKCTTITYNKASL